MRSKQQEPTLDELLAIAHSIGERAASQAEQAEKDCKLADEIVEDINKARLIQVLQPKRFGGLEMGFPAMVRISQALAQHDMAASWIYSLFAIHHFWRDFYAIAQHVVFNYEVGTRNYGRFLLGLEPLPAIY